MSELRRTLAFLFVQPPLNTPLRENRHNFVSVSFLLVCFFLFTFCIFTRFTLHFHIYMYVNAVCIMMICI